MRKHTVAGLLLVPVILGTAACKGGEQQGQQEQPAATQQQEVGQVSYELQITNPMPHAMTVFADYGAGESQLGVVQPNQTATFTITSPASPTVRLRARDEGGSHEVTGEAALTQGMASSWTIGG